MTTREYDLIVIGAGPVGETVADRAQAGGLSVVIVEAELIGGECSYWACIPSKALLRPGAAITAARRVTGAAEAVTGSLDVAAVHSVRVNGRGIRTIHSVVIFAATGRVHIAGVWPALTTATVIVGAIVPSINLGWNERLLD